MRIWITVAAYSLLIVASVAAGQTFEVGGQQSQPGSQKNRSSKSSASGTPSEGIGWGSSIEVSRIARGAQDALRRGEVSKAADFAQRAAQAAPQNPDFWFLYGYCARLAGRFQSSIDAYNHGLRLRPSSIQGLSGLAQTYVHMGRIEEAKKLLMRVIAANPKSADDLLLAGELFLNSGDQQRALPLLERGEAASPSARGELLLAKTYKTLNQPDRAKQMLERAKNRAPNNPDVLRSVAGYYRDTGDYNAAISALRQVRSRNPDVLGELAYTYKLAGRRNEAAQTYVQAANASPRNINLQLSAAEALLNDGNSGQARNFLDRAAAIQPDHYRVHALRGDIARMEERVAEAIREYEFALKTVPEGAPEGVLYPLQLRMTLAQLYRDDNNETAARQQVALAAEQIKSLQVEGPNRPEFLRLRAAIESDNNDIQGADRDLKEAASLDPSNSNIALQYANLLWKESRKVEARQMFLQVLEREPSNRFALISIGHLSRDMGDVKGAEAYLNRAVQHYPRLYIPYLALGDLYTSVGQFSRALTFYEKGYALAPRNPLIVAGGANASLESHNMDLAKMWLARAQGEMNNNPEVMRERERYLTWLGKYEESAKLGWQVIQKLPRDREAPIYLAYDLLYLNRYDDALRVAQTYQPILPREKDLWLIAGYVHTHYELLSKAVDDFSHALELDPNMATGYVNRGFVLNDVQNAKQAARDFERAIRLRPDYGEAHLGLAYSNLQLHHPKLALQQVDTAERLLGESKATHLARAGAFRQQLLLGNAEKEYRAALKYAPDDVQIHLSLAETLYRLHRYNDSIDALNNALILSPNDPFVYAQLAHNYARLHRREDTLRYIQAAEREGGDETDVLLATGDALLTLGDRGAAMEHFARALNAPDAQRVDARLALARVFTQEGHYDDARQQVSLAFAEARIGEAGPVTSDDLVEAADLFLQMHDFELAKRYFDRARLAGADDTVVAIGMANAYLAQGQTQNAEAQLASLGSASDYDHNYDYMMATANVYRQRQDTGHALAAMARANGLAANDDAAEQAQLELAGQEGRQITENFSMQSEASFAPIFEDENIYQMDARLLNPSTTALLPTPRSSYESKADARFKYRHQGWPTITGFVEERNARGRISFPSEFLIQDRNTYDTAFSAGVNSVLRWGSNTIVFNPGLQFTIRRDTRSPIDLNQNLFRQYLYMSSSPFFNILSVSGAVMHETGPFTLRDLHSRDLLGEIAFTVGRPWGKTSLITSYTTRDILFRPLIREYYQTTTAIGLQRKFTQKFTAGILGEYLRAWRVQDAQFAIAQSMRPAGRFDYRPTNRWAVQGRLAYSRGQGSHFYDNVTSEFLLTYIKPMRHIMSAGDGDVAISYPFRVSVGFQQQTFYNFPGQHGSDFLPVIGLSVF